MQSGESGRVYYGAVPPAEDSTRLHADVWYVCASSGSSGGTCLRSWRGGACLQFSTDTGGFCTGVTEEQVVFHWTARDAACVRSLPHDACLAFTTEGYEAEARPEVGEATKYAVWHSALEGFDLMSAFL